MQNLKLILLLASLVFLSACSEKMTDMLYYPDGTPGKQISK
ncbi:hypothetical protein ACMTF7_001584 [Campylobacter jejuni]